MKKLLVLTVLLAATFSYAQDIDSFIELLRMDVKTQKAAIITDAMELTDEESEKFWKVYREFDAEMAKINDERVALIKDYANSFDKMVDETAKKLANKSFKINEDKTKLRKKYFNKFEKEIGAVKAARFFQVERQIDILIDTQISSELPLIQKPSDMIK